MPNARRDALAYVRIVRPGNVILTAFAAWVGGLSAYVAWSADLALACASAALIAAGGYVANDICDVEIDRLNRPDRPLPAGEIGMRTATAWSAILIVSGLALSIPLGPAHWLIAIVAAGSLVLYAVRLKATFVAGHLLVATIAALTFLYGGLTGPRPRMALVPALLAWGFHLGREFLKSAADREGDLAAGADTLAARWGTRAACRASVIPLTIVMILSPAPFVWGWHTASYLVIVSVGVVPVLAVTVWKAWRAGSGDVAQRLAVLLKWDMVIGLAAIGGDRCLSWQ